VIIVPVPGPRETHLPLPEGEDPREFLFHPTASSRAPLLERRGLRPEERPFQPEDLLRLLEIYEELQYDGELSGVTPRAVLEDGIRRPGQDHPFQWLTPFYLTARNRAVVVPLGETHRGVLRATEELARLLGEPARRAAHERLLREWDDREREHLGQPLERGEVPAAVVASMQRRERALNAVHDEAYCREALRKVRSIRDRYLEEGKGSYPVVYALRIPREERRVPLLEKGRGAEFRLVTPLPPERFAYRIDLDPAAQEVAGSDPEELGDLQPATG
jgi:hypothetical protein